MFQPPEIAPALLPLSSTRNSFHAPLATTPFSAESFVPVGAPCGAGALKTSFGSKLVGL